jgi:hypothetical protein
LQDQRESMDTMMQRGIIRKPGEWEAWRYDDRIQWAYNARCAWHNEVSLLNEIYLLESVCDVGAFKGISDP